ncbi:MAG TPA: hypothetical protein VIK18_18965 [Pirellulales bacterium]
MLVHKETDLLERILAECEDDYVGLWSILRQVREARYPQPKAVTLALLRYLLSTGIIEAGEPDASGGFQVWKTSADETMSRIGSEWSALGHDPDLGDIAWFTTPVRAARS